MKKFYIFCFFSMIFLSGCGNQTLTYETFMLNPKLLQKEYNHCAKTDDSHCDVVKRAAFDFERLYEEQSLDAQAFGIKVMQQQANVKALANDANSKAYKDALFTLKTYYSVLGLHSPQ